MPLYKLENFYQDYNQVSGREDIKAFNLYTQGGNRIGSVAEVLVDGEGRFRYLVIQTGLLGLGKSILLPIGLAYIRYPEQRVIVDGLSKDQVEQLPEYKDGMVVDHDHEHQVRAVYKNDDKAMAADRASVDSYSYDRDPLLYEMDESRHGSLLRYQERLRTPQ